MEDYTTNNPPSELTSLYVPELMTFNTKLMQKMVDDLNAGVIKPVISINQLFTQYWSDQMHHNELLNGAILRRHFQDALKKWCHETGYCLVLITSDSKYRGHIDVEGNGEKFILEAFGLLIVNFYKAMKKSKEVKMLPKGEVTNFEYFIYLAPRYGYKKADGPFIELYNEKIGNFLLPCP